MVSAYVQVYVQLMFKALIHFELFYYSIRGLVLFFLHVEILFPKYTIYGRDYPFPVVYSGTFAGN